MKFGNNIISSSSLWIARPCTFYKQTGFTNQPINFYMYKLTATHVQMAFDKKFCTILRYDLTSRTSTICKLINKIQMLSLRMCLQLIDDSLTAQKCV